MGPPFLVGLGGAGAREELRVTEEMQVKEPSMTEGGKLTKERPSEAKAVLQREPLAIYNT